MSATDPPSAGADTPENNFDIDWTKEPASERERRVRAVMLRKALAERPSFVRLEMHSLLHDSVPRCLFPEDAASDFREAYAQAQAISDQFSTERKKRRLEAAIREVDGARE